jgi:phosphatidylinositol glycan class S
VSRASHFARQAIVSAEEAFFDKTLLSLLYFPSEHIYAMYMPFFVPATIPILAAVFEKVKAWRSLSRGKAHKID